MEQISHHATAYKCQNSLWRRIRKVVIIAQRGYFSVDILYHLCNTIGIQIVWLFADHTFLFPPQGTRSATSQLLVE